jgi:hypothetical protein
LAIGEDVAAGGGSSGTPLPRPSIVTASLDELLGGRSPCRRPAPVDRPGQGVRGEAAGPRRGLRAGRGHPSNPVGRSANHPHRLPSRLDHPPAKRPVHRSVY